MRLAWCFPLSFLMKGVRSRGPFHEDIFRVRRVGDRTFRPWSIASGVESKEEIFLLCFCP